MLNVVFGKSTMRRTQVQLWYKEERADVKDDIHPGAVKKMIWIIVKSLKEGHNE